MVLISSAELIQSFCLFSCWLFFFFFSTCKLGSFVISWNIQHTRKANSTYYHSARSSISFIMFIVVIGLLPFPCFRKFMVSVSSLLVSICFMSFYSQGCRWILLFIPLSFFIHLFIRFYQKENLEKKYIYSNCIDKKYYFEKCLLIMIWS